jgi:Ni,Fe-hydrogenase I small subunit
MRFTSPTDEVAGSPSCSLEPHHLMRMCARRVEPGGCLEDVPGDNDGHQRPTAVYPNSVHDQRKRRDQHRLTAQSLDGMQEVRHQLGPKGVALRGPYAVGTDARID